MLVATMSKVLSPEQIAAQYEALQADRDMMREWLNTSDELYYGPHITSLRDYRDAAENAYFATFKATTGKA